ncbi:MAG: hypothetical protein J4F28_08710 [Nitrosopumilaceae archaeon]|nr:hypothetical protein [Nitrosopumilaceae archaeon]
MMKYKLFLILALVAVLAYSLGFAASEIDKSYVMNLETQEDLSKIVDILYDEMIESGIVLTNHDIDLLVAPDRNADVLIITPNDMKKYHRGPFGSFGTYDNFYIFLENGIRIYTEVSHNGDVLKNIKINDVPEKRITMIIKDDG